MKWNELEEKAKVKLLVDLRVINTSMPQAYAYITPEQLDVVAPVAHKAGSIFTIYPENVPHDVELFNEMTDDVMFMDPQGEIPAYFEVL